MTEADLPLLVALRQSSRTGVEPFRGYMYQLH